MTTRLPAKTRAERDAVKRARNLDRLATQIQETGDAEIAVHPTPSYREHAVAAVSLLLQAAERVGINLDFALVTVAGYKARLQVLPGGRTR